MNHEDQKCKVILVYIVSSRPSWGTQDPRRWGDLVLRAPPIFIKKEKNWREWHTLVSFCFSLLGVTASSLESVTGWCHLGSRESPSPKIKYHITLVVNTGVLQWETNFHHFSSCGCFFRNARADKKRSGHARPISCIYGNVQCLLMALCGSRELARIPVIWSFMTPPETDLFFLFFFRICTL